MRGYDLGNLYRALTKLQAVSTRVLRLPCAFTFYVVYFFVIFFSYQITVSQYSHEESDKSVEDGERTFAG